MASGNFPFTVVIIFLQLGNELFLTRNEPSLIGKGIFLMGKEPPVTGIIKFPRGIGHYPVEII